MKSSSKIQIFLIIGVIFIFLIYQVVSLYGGQYAIVNFPPNSNTIVALGDSLTVGVGASAPENNFISVLERRLNITIVNKGVVGNTAGDALARIDSDIATLHPGVVIVLLGGNDYLRKIPPQETFTSLRGLIKKIQSEGAVVLLLGIQKGLSYDKSSDDFQKIARDTGSLFVPAILDGILGNAKLMSDEVHPNDAGYLKIADKIAPTLEGLVLSVITHDPHISTRGDTDSVRTSPSSE